jgi:hypothetical protein
LPISPEGDLDDPTAKPESYDQKQIDRCQPTILLRISSLPCHRTQRPFSSFLAKTFDWPKVSHLPKEVSFFDSRTHHPVKDDKLPSLETEKPTHGNSKSLDSAATLLPKEPGHFEL